MPASGDSGGPGTAPADGVPKINEPRSAGVPKISVVVPVYNPGSYIEACAGSLLRQTMSAADFEVVFVDDGSTDKTPQRLDDLAAEHEHVQVIHQENSGWSGKPRNVGVDTARGDYVLFMDNDDWLEDDALERMYDFADANGSDILIPRYVGHGRGVARELFSKNIPRTDLRRTPQVIDSMTPHKMVRRTFLLDHGLRFPEGPRRLEDHVFFIEAYLLAGTISVLSDRPCYHHLNRDDGGNAARTPYDPKGYFGNVREVLDIIDTHTEPGEFRDRLYQRWYGAELMGRVNRRTFLRHPEEFQEQIFTEVHRLSLERFGEHLIDRFGATRRVRAHLIREGDLETYRTFLAHDLKVRARARLTRARWSGEQTLAVELAGTLDHPDAPLFRERDGRIAYALPGKLDELLPDSATTVTEEALRGKVRLVLHGRKSGVEHFVPLSSVALTFAPVRHPDAENPGDPDHAGDAGSGEDAAGSGGRCLAFTANATIDVSSAATGSRLPVDDWEFRVRLATCSWLTTVSVWPLEGEPETEPGTGPGTEPGTSGSAAEDAGHARLAATNGRRRTVLRIARRPARRAVPTRPAAAAGGWRQRVRRVPSGLRRLRQRVRDAAP